MNRPLKKILLGLQNKMRRLGSDAEYADFRYVEIERSRIRTKNDALDDVRETVSRGAGFRVLAGGSFGFSATGNLSEQSLTRHLNQAYEMARRFSKIRHADVKLVPAKPVKARWAAMIKKDPWSLSLKQKMEPLLEAGRKLKQYSWIDSALGHLDFTRKNITFVSSEGSWIEQTLYRTGGWMNVESWISESGGRKKIVRSWPATGGPFRAEGYEAIERLPLTKEVKRIAEELKELRMSPESPSGTFDLILAGSILALQIHETFGHASESDRVYGYEDNFGGRTFLNPGLLGSFEAASPEVTIVSDGLGSFAFDDEGVPARRVEIVKKGIFTNYLSSRETATFLNQPSSSASMIAQDWSHYPLIRMTNTNLLPGKGTLKQMVADTEEGFLLDNEMSWAIDELRLNFQIGAEAGYYIKNGKIKGLVRFPLYSGNTLDFWRSCDRVAGKSEWDFWGFDDCGKGAPYQEAFTGHGVSPARFRNVRFGRE